MKKILSILLALAMLTACASAFGETIVNAAEERNIAIQPAGENTVPANISPVTGRDLTTLPLPDGFLGMVATGVYYPVMVQHNGYASGTGNAAPWNGTYADVYYEQPKARTGYTRLTMLFNDYFPQYVGASRSIRVGHVWNRQEWDAMFVYAGMQEAVNSKFNTSVPEAVRALGLKNSENPDVPMAERVLFNALNQLSAKTRPWTLYRYRVKGLDKAYNVVWDLQALYMDVFPKDKTFPNHTWKFADGLPEEGDNAEVIYVMFNKEHGKTGNIDKEDGVFYFNSMLQYDAESNQYYRYLISDRSNPWHSAKEFTELVPSNVKITKEDDWYRISCDRTQGDPITFSNVIVQFIDMEWPGSEQPYPILTGTGNADYFMGGKHISGVWQRDTYDDRTVFYGPDGQEISLQRGRTLIVQMDYKTTVNGVNVRELKYE